MRFFIYVLLLALALAKDCKCCDNGRVISTHNRCNPRLGQLPLVMGKCITSSARSQLQVAGLITAIILNAVQSGGGGFGSGRGGGSGGGFGSGAPPCIIVFA